LRPRTSAGLGLISFVFPLMAQAGTLSLSEFLVKKWVRKNNVKVQLAELDRFIAAAEKEAAPVDFDVHGTLSLSYEESKNLSNFSFEDAITREQTRSASLGFTKKFSPGTEAELSWQTLRVKTSSSTALFGTRYQTAALAKISQPLLKGAWSEFNESKIRKAKVKLQRFLAQLNETILENQQKAVTAYWQLVRLQDELKIEHDAIEVAKNLLVINKKLHRAGKKSDTDLLYSAAKLEVAKAKAVLVQSKIIDSESELFQLVFAVDKPLADTKLQAKDSFLGPKATTPVKMRELLNKLNQWPKGKTHPKIQRMTFELNEAEIDLKEAKNGTLPTLDLTLEYLLSGLGDKGSEAKSHISGQKFPSFEIGLSFSMPFPGLSGEGNYRQKSVNRNRKEQEVQRQHLKNNEKIRAARLKIGEIADVMESLEKRLKLEKEKIKIKKYLYRVGRIEWRELNEALKDYFNLRLERVKQLQSYHMEKTTALALLASL